MVFDGLQGDKEFIFDIPVALALADQLNDLLLPPGDVEFLKQVFDRLPGFGANSMLREHFLDKSLHEQDGKQVDDQYLQGIQEDIQRERNHAEYLEKIQDGAW